jgi:hypothetical protein
MSAGIAGLGRAAAGAAPDTGLAITIHVCNYAGVASQTLHEAEQAAGAVFRNAGVTLAWEEMAAAKSGSTETSSAAKVSTLSDIRLNIVSDLLLGRPDLPSNALGVAPGQGPGRGTIYVFDERIKTLFWGLMDAHLIGTRDVLLSKGQILGYVIAHEVGHLLLNEELHSTRGIMRGSWGIGDLRSIASGLMRFTPKEAEGIRADIRNRKAGG